MNNHLHEDLDEISNAARAQLYALMVMLALAASLVIAVFVAIGILS